MKKLVLFALLAVSLYGVDIDDIEFGDIYYLNGGFLNDDRRVMVVKVSRSKGKVKVKADNGDTEWVYPSKLLTKNQNENENLAHPFMALVGLAALSARSNENVRNTDGGYYIKAHNECSETMELAIYYMPFKSSVWKVEYWWEVKPNQSIYLLNDDDSRLATKIETLYYYAESKYRKKYKISGNKLVFISGKKYWMKKLIDKEGATDIVLRCN